MACQRERPWARRAGVGGKEEVGEEGEGEEGVREGVVERREVMGEGRWEWRAVRALMVCVAGGQGDVVKHCLCIRIAGRGTHPRNAVERDGLEPDVAQELASRGGHDGVRGGVRTVHTFR